MGTNIFMDMYKKTWAGGSQYYKKEMEVIFWERIFMSCFSSVACFYHNNLILMYFIFF